MNGAAFTVDLELDLCVFLDVQEQETHANQWEQDSHDRHKERGQIGCCVHKVFPTNDSFATVLRTRKPKFSF